MIKIRTLCSLLSLFLVFTACIKEGLEGGGDSPSRTMLFGIQAITQTRVAYTDQANGGLSATFEERDEIGLYAYYNNFYYYYTDYLNFAESVIFANQGLEVNALGEATYSPLRSWTFSTLYGTAPHTLDCFAYYPFREGYHPEYLNMTHDLSGKATFIYNYVVGSEVHAHVDFMTAHTRYDDSKTPEKFRSDMLALESIPLSFTRRTASLNLRVTKPVGYGDIQVTGITVHYRAYTQFTQEVGSTPSWKNWTKDELQFSVACTKTLEETQWGNTPGEDATLKGDLLLTNEQMLYFPPESEINKIVFTVTDKEVEKNYTWHPHIAPIEANTHFVLNLELDPARAN